MEFCCQKLSEQDGIREQDEILLEKIKRKQDVMGLKITTLGNIKEGGTFIGVNLYLRLCCAVTYLVWVNTS